MKARTFFHGKVFEEKEKKFQLAAKQAARTELLLQESAGYFNVCYT